MTQREELLSFIRAARDKGIPDQSLIALLEGNGWPSKEIFAALRDYYEAIASVPVPARRGFAEGAREAFLHLLSFGTLATWVTALGAILFAQIDSWLPDPVMFRSAVERSSVAAPLASLLVAFPAYLLVMRQIVRDMRNDPDKRESAVRKWLTWFALFIAAIVVLGDLIVVLTWLLRGEVTARFLLQAAVVFGLAGGVFWFYLTSLRETAVRTGRFAVAAAAAVLAGLIAGFTILGTPSGQRDIEADRRRVEQLRQIATVLHVRGALPENLQELSIRAVDPVTRQPFEYRRLSPTQYELCAVFQTSLENTGVWTHGAGRHCFTLDSSKDVRY